MGRLAAGLSDRLGRVLEPSLERRRPQLALRTLIPAEVRRWVKIRRAQAFHLAGSERYGRPALSHLDSQMLAYLPERGTFLEIGANDGYSQSNTYYLERFRGWEGILIEPLPHLNHWLRRIRRRSESFNVACVADPRTTSVTVLDDNLQTVALGQQSAEDEQQRAPRDARQFVVPAATLSSVIDLSRFDAITFMSIDVEGAEMAVLGGLDLKRHCPEFLLVETKYPDTIDELVAGHLSRRAQLSFHDFLWTRSGT